MSCHSFFVTFTLDLIEGVLLIFSFSVQLVSVAKQYDPHFLLPSACHYEGYSSRNLAKSQGNLKL